jgi:disulfide bond formation protein DsbB
MAGSLFFQYGQGYPPCVLCWYQRIAMYPLVFILGAAILAKKKDIALYVLPLSIVGGLISVFHNLLYYNIIPESQAPCEQGISCTTKFIEWFGFVTIPLLSLASFAIIIIAMLVYRNSQK